MKKEDCCVCTVLFTLPVKLKRSQKTALKSVEKPLKILKQGRRGEAPDRD